MRFSMIASRQLGLCLALLCSTSASLAAAADGLVASPKKGVGVVDYGFAHDSADLLDARVAWTYNWGAFPWKEADALHSGIEFVPMINNASDVNAQQLQRAAASGKILLGFNEPDHVDQSNISVEKALNLWPQLMATGMVLGSPVMANDPSDAGSWLERFMDGVATRGYRVDFICVHWYGKDFNTDASVAKLKAYLIAAHDKFQKPIWLTEYALIRWVQDSPTHWYGVYPTAEQQAAFAAASTQMLESLPFVQRYAWFGLSHWPTGISGETTNLYDWNGQPTAVGKAFSAAALVPQP